MKKLPNAVKWLIIVAVLAAMAAMFALGLLYRGQLTLDALLGAAPRSLLVAALFLVALYLCKSLSIMFPILVLYGLGGLLFPPALAVAVNVLGVAAGLALPYWIGRISGAGLVDALIKRWPKARQLTQMQRQGTWFFPFFLRIIGFLPCDVVSLYLGASRHPFGPYLLGGLAGMMPGILTGTLMGAHVAEPTSPVFEKNAVPFQRRGLCIGGGRLAAGLSPVPARARLTKPP
mgnify:CR=1 FL=1